MLRELVALPSVSCSAPELDQDNQEVINLLGNWLESIRFTVEVLPLPDKPGKANLIATLGEGEDGLVLAGHTDTVPCDEDHWSVDPFELWESEGRLYGLGSCDMKGFFPVALSAARNLCPNRLKKPLTIVATSDEETTMAGARHLARLGKPKAEAAVIGEPTSMRPIYAHKGILILRIQLDGASGHASNPSLGQNALEGMHEIMGAVLKFRTELRQRYKDEAFDVRYPTINLGCLHAGDCPKRICAKAVLEIDIRMLPGMDIDNTASELSARLKSVADTIGISISVTQNFPSLPPYETSREGELIKTLEALSGYSSTTAAFGTEAPFLSDLGMETAIFGPGSIDQAHQPDEYLDRDRLVPAQRVIEGLIQHYCC